MSVAIFVQLLAREIPSASGFPGTRLQLVLSKSRVLPPNGSFNRENGDFRSFQNFGGHDYLKSCLFSFPRISFGAVLRDRRRI